MFIRSAHICMAVFVGVVVWGVPSSGSATVAEGTLRQESPPLSPGFSIPGEGQLARDPQREERYHKKHHEIAQDSRSRQPEPGDSGGRRQSEPGDSGGRRQSEPGDSGGRRQSEPGHDGDGRRHSDPVLDGGRHHVEPGDSGGRRHSDPVVGDGRRRSSEERKRIRCASEGGRHEYCETGPGYIRLERQHSRIPCVEYDTWGREGDGVWVRNGCRATFVVEEHSPGIIGGGYGWWGNKSVVCKSEGYQYNHCPLKRQGRRVRIVRQLSETRCVQKDNWGTNRDGIWVDLGCGGEFVVE
jgi:hypothetical protein